MAHFLKGLRRFVLDEAQATRQALAAVWSMPLRERVAAGRAIDGLTITGFQPNGLLELRCERNQSRFREGDILNLNQGDPHQQPNELVTIEVDQQSRLLVSGSSMGMAGSALGRPVDNWVLDEAALDLTPSFLESLDEVGDTINGRVQILPLIMDRRRPRPNMPHYERGLEIAERQGLNDEQAEAFAQAYATDLTYLVQGPPGTGKTRLLAHLVQTLVADGERVLVTALTHRAINNALNKIVDIDATIPVAKIGRLSTADDLIGANYEKFYESPMADMERGYAIGATPFALRSSRLKGIEFDTVIFDEASQITIPLAMMGMLAGRRFIFIGDQEQLPPVTTTRGHQLFGDSVFARLSDNGFETMLTTTYRLSQALAEWSSQHFYQGQLEPAPGIVTQRVDYPRPPFRLLNILEPDAPKVFWDVGQRNTTTRSRQEADAVVSLIDALLGCGFPAAEIAVIVPYRAQAREIRSQLMLLDPELRLFADIVIDTVERMQGQERDLVILSLTTSSPAFASRQAEFFFQPQRLNVAVTRARKKLVIVGSRYVLQAHSSDPEIAEQIELLRDLINSCTVYRQPE